MMLICVALGMYKADICRAAYLYLHGGYYFDVDVLGESGGRNISCLIFSAMSILIIYPH